MNVSQAEFQNMKEEIVKDLIVRLMEERSLSMTEAFDAVYTSRLFEKLSNPKTGLYFQSSGYVYSFLDSELKANSQVGKVAGASSGNQKLQPELIAKSNLEGDVLAV